jgi:hypothetical protein
VSLIVDVCRKLDSNGFNLHIYKLVVQFSQSDITPKSVLVGRNDAQSRAVGSAVAESSPSLRSRCFLAAHDVERNYYSPGRRQLMG